MNKLTKEQSEWLIANLCTEEYTDCCSSNEATHEMIEKIINQCTEKEFPEFEMPIKRLDRICIGNLKLSLSPGYGIFIDTPEDNIMLWKKEFQLFTEACKKVCEWLEEQE